VFSKSNISVVNFLSLLDLHLKKLTLRSTKDTKLQRLCVEVFALQTGVLDLTLSKTGILYIYSLLPFHLIILRIYKDIILKYFTSIVLTVSINNITKMQVIQL